MDTDALHTYEDVEAVDTDVLHTYEDVEAVDTDAMHTYEDVEAEDTDAMHIYEDVEAEDTDAMHTYEDVEAEDTLAMHTYESVKALDADSVGIQMSNLGFSWVLQAGPEGDGSANFMSDNDDIMLHINPRPERSQIALNTMESNGQWGKEEIIPYTRNFFRVNVTEIG